LQRYADDVRDLLPGVTTFAWSPARSRTGGAKAVGTGEHAGQVLYGADAEAALAGPGAGAHAGTPEAAGEDAARKLAAGDPDAARRFADGARKAAADLAATPPAPELAGPWQEAAAGLPAGPKKELGTFVGTFARERDPGLIEKAFRGLVNWFKGLPLATAKLAFAVLKRFAAALAPPESLSPKRWLPPAAFYVGSLATAAAVMALPVAAVASGLAPFAVGLLAAPAAVGAGVLVGKKLRRKGAELVGANYFPNQYGSGTGRPGSIYYGKIPLKGDFAEAARDQVVPAGPDGKRAAELLAAAREDGTRLFVDACEKAVGRLLASGDPLASGTLFEDEELEAIAEGLARAIASADLLGRARIRRRAEMNEKRFGMNKNGAGGYKPAAIGDQTARSGDNPGISKFRDSAFAEADDDPFHSFDEAIPPLPPRQALDYFNRLVPSLSPRVERYGPKLDRYAFTLAASADEVILERVKKAILESLEEGESATPNVEDILDEAGVSMRNPQYAELVVRTNVLDALNQGAQAELATPEMQEAFPVWEYLGILDDRTGDDHRPKIGKFYPASAAFHEVRGPRVFNCRCSLAGVHRLDPRLKSIKVEETW
jgi:hypothetical protein